MTNSPNKISKRRVKVLRLNSAHINTNTNTTQESESTPAQSAFRNAVQATKQANRESTIGAKLAKKAKSAKRPNIKLFYIIIAILVLLLTCSYVIAFRTESQDNDFNPITLLNEENVIGINYPDLDVSKVIDLEKSFNRDTALFYAGGIKEHTRGNADSNITVTLYIDLQCPACAAIIPVFDEIYEINSKRAAFVYRHTPLSSIHQNAVMAARAAEAAGLQGKYFEMVKALFNTQKSWASLSDKNLTNKFTEIFKQVAPNGRIAKFKKDINSEEVKRKVDFDIALSNQSIYINKTPSIFVNGQEVNLDGVKSSIELQNLVSEMITEQAQKNTRK